MFNCDIMFKVKTKMRHKIERIPLLALFLSAATSVVAGEVVSVSLPDPMFNNCESTAKAMLPILEAGTSERLVVSINCPNTITNEFEVWFCTDEDASREFRDLAISLDDGYLFVSGRDDENLLQDWTSMPWGQCHLGIELRNRLYSQESLLVKSVVNGMQIPALAMGLEMASPREWRSVKAVSRGMLDASDVMVTISKGEVGFSVILR